MGSMMKRLFGCFLIFSLAFAPVISFAHEAGEPEDMIYYTDEDDDDLFHKGKFVGAENDDYLRAQRRVRTRNWSIAIGTTALGIAALLLAKK